MGARDTAWTERAAMNVVITGGAGFLGRKLALELLKRGTLPDAGGREREIERLTLFDIVEPAGLPDDDRLRPVAGDIGDRAVVESLIGPGTDGVFHLAAIVSANAEQDFDLGMRVNLDGTRYILDACRALPNTPRLVFASSVAVYGGEVPEVLDDLTILTPETSYGTQKAIGEMLVQDYSRKGFLDGRSLRLPTIVVRPGAPNLAASTFASSIVREPLAGQEAICPVAPEAAMYVLSPRKVIEALVRAYELPPDAWGRNRRLLLPGLTVRIGAMVEALAEVAGRRVADRIRWEPDERIRAGGRGGRARRAARRARELGFRADADVREIIRAHIEDELGGEVR
jgi:D-erythronate 2-dehydrogenase